MSPDDRSGGSAREVVRDFLRRPAVNALVRTSLRPFARWLPARMLCRLPVVGEVTASLPSGARLRPGGVRRSVRAVRVDTLVQPERIRRVDRLKPDADGAEPAFLAGARALPERDAPWMICEVLHGVTEAGLHAELDPLGHCSFALTSGGLEPGLRIVDDPTYRAPDWLFAMARRLGACPQV
jgi:hypothetical protein